MFRAWWIIQHTYVLGSKKWERIWHKKYMKKQQTRIISNWRHTASQDVTALHFWDRCIERKATLSHTEYTNERHKNIHSLHRKNTMQNNPLFTGSHTTNVIMVLKVTSNLKIYTPPKKIQSLYKTDLLKQTKPTIAQPT